MASLSVAPIESSIKKHKRVRVKKACTNCRLAKTCCSATRPCARCTRLGLEANCRDLTPQGAEEMVSSSSTPGVLSEKEKQDVELMKQYVGGYRPASASDVSMNQKEIPVPYDWVMSSVLNNQHVPAVPFSQPHHIPHPHSSLSSNRSAPPPVSASAPFAFLPASSQPVSSISSNIQYYQQYQQQQQQQQQPPQQQPQQQFFQQQQQVQHQFYQEQKLSDSSSSSASSSECPLEMSDFTSTTVFDTDAKNKTLSAESHEDSMAPNSPPGVVPSADSPDISLPSDMRCPNEPTPAYYMRRFINQQQKQRQEEQKQQQQQREEQRQQSSQQQNPQEEFNNNNNPVGSNMTSTVTATMMSGSSLSVPQMADVSSFVKQDPSYSLSLSPINSFNSINSGPRPSSPKESPSSVCTSHSTMTPAYFGMVGATEDQMIMLPPNVVREIELLRNENLTLRDKVSQLMYKLEVSRLSNSSWYRDTLMTNPTHLAYSTWLFPTSVLLDYNDFFFEILRPELKPLAKARQMTCKVLFLPRHTAKCSRVLSWLGKGLARYLEIEQLWWKDDREIPVISSVRIQYNDEGHPVRLDMISQHRPHVLVPPVDSPEYDRFFMPLAVEAPALEHLFQLASEEQERSPHLTPKAITDASPFFSIDPCRSFADS